MKTIFSYWFMCMALSVAPSYAMHQGSTQKESLADRIPLLIEYLSAYQAVQQTGYLNADGLKSFIGSAQSRVIYPMVCGLDMIIKTHQSGGLASYPAGFLLSTIKAIPEYSAHIEACEQSVCDGSPISDALKKVRHIQKYTLKFISENADQVNHWFSIISEEVGPHMPIILAGLRAMQAEHERIAAQRRIEVRKKYAALRAKNSQELMLRRKRRRQLEELAYDNDDDDDQYNPIAEYNRIYNELVPTGCILNEGEMTISIPLREIEGRDKGMTDWFK